MATFEIYHNPRCSKSRAALKLLEENGIEPTIRLYLDNPPDAAELKRVIQLLSTAPRGLIRDGENEYEELGLADETLSDDRLIEAMIFHPRLIQRPIVIRDGKVARIGRPPEAVLDLVG